MNIKPQIDPLPTRASLIGRLRDLDDACSWNEFVCRYKQRIIHIARSRGLDIHDAEEVAQEVFHGVARNICRFKSSGRPGSFRRWLFQRTRWRATDQGRERARFLSIHQDDNPCQDGSGYRTPTVERVPAPCLTEASFREEASRHAVDTLIKQIEHAVTPKQLQIFQLLVLDEAEPAKVAKLYGMKVGAVYTTKNRVAGKLRDEIIRARLRLQ